MLVWMSGEGGLTFPSQAGSMQATISNCASATSVARQLLPTVAAHVQGSATPHSHIEYRIGRPACGWTDRSSWRRGLLETTSS